VCTTIAIANQKGGVAKTTTALNLGAELAKRGRTVTLIDVDPQASLSISLSISAPEKSIVEVLGDHRPGTKAVSQVIRQVNEAGKLWLVPSDIALASTSVGMERRAARETLLKQALSTVNGDYVLIDCPPSLGLLTVNALVAADMVLIPVQCEFLAMRGLAFFWKTLQEIQPLNPSLRVLGILPTMYRRKTKHHQQALAAMQEHIKATIFAPIPLSVRASDAHAQGKAVSFVDAANPVAEAYTALAREVDREW
jgi:chromosome partitioning protein